MNEWISRTCPCWITSVLGLAVVIQSAILLSLLFDKETNTLPARNPHIQHKEDINLSPYQPSGANVTTIRVPSDYTTYEPIDDYETVFLITSDGSSYQEWTFKLFLYAWNRIGRPGRIQRVISGKPTHPYKVAPVPTHYAPEKGSYNGDRYPPYNRPAGILEWMKSVEKMGVDNPYRNSTIIVTDPDMVFVKFWKPYVHEGSPVAQQYSYMDVGYGKNEDIINRHTNAVDNVQPVGPPIVLHFNDLKKVVQGWWDKTVEVRADRDNDEFKETGTPSWVAEMWGYVFSAAEVGFKHQLKEFANSPPWDSEIKDTVFIHYTYEFKAKIDKKQEGVLWSKRWFIEKPPSDPIIPENLVAFAAILNDAIQSKFFIENKE